MTSPDTLGSQFRSLRDHVVDNIRDRIVEGRLPGGHRLVERDLSAEMEVSRITIREALQQLTGEGLVVQLPRRGSVVTDFGGPEILNLLELREPLEVLAARLAAQRHDSAGAERLAAIQVACRTAVQAGNLDEAATASVQFHEEIARCTGNALLQAHMASLHGHLRRLFWMTREHQGHHVDEHARILEAILARQADHAAALAGDHVRETTENTLRMLEVSPRA